MAVPTTDAAVNLIRAYVFICANARSCLSGKNTKKTGGQSCGRSAVRIQVSYWKRLSVGATLTCDKDACMGELVGS
jgi:hypothetical protein